MKKITFLFVAFVFLCFQAISQGDIDITLSQDNAGSVPPSGTVLSPQNPTDAPLFDAMCDHFDSPDGTSVPGWTEATGDWWIVNNMLRSPGTYEWEYITMDGTIQTDGCITLRAVYNTSADVQFVGAVGRFTDIYHNILFKIQDNNSGPPYNWNSIWLYQGQTYMQYYLTGLDLGTDAIIQLEYTGSNITVRVDKERDGTWEIEETAEGAPSAGLCGVAGYHYGLSDDYCCGSDCIYESIPVANWAIVLAVVLIGGFIALRRFRVM